MSKKPVQMDPDAAIDKAPCPCGSSRRYEQCCQGLHHRTDPVAATPEPLMRSRYSAFVLGLSDYLLASWAPETRPTEPFDVATDIRWLGLKIVGVTVSPNGQSGTVEFVARSRVQGKGQRLHELSRFRRDTDCWLYVDGDLS